MADQPAEQQLLAAAREGDESTLCQLLEGGGDIAAYQEDKDGASALIVAAKQVRAPLAHQ